MTATRPKPRPGLLDIAPYVPGKSSAPGVAKVFKLSSNETPLGPSPKAIAAYQAAGAHLEDYPDGSAGDLREAIGRAFDGAALLVSVERGGIKAVSDALVGIGASIRSTALVGSHATRYTVPDEVPASR